MARLRSAAKELIRYRSSRRFRRPLLLHRSSTAARGSTEPADPKVKHDQSAPAVTSTHAAFGAPTWLVLVSLGSVVLVADLMLAVVPVCLNHEFLYGPVPVPAALAAGLTLLLAAMTYALSRRPESRLTSLWIGGMLLLIVAYFAFPFHSPGGFSLALASTGRLMVFAFALLVLLRSVGSSPHSATLPLTAALFAVSLGALVSDVAAIAIQSSPNYVHTEFRSFAVIFLGATALLLMVSLVLLPHINTVGNANAQTSQPLQPQTVAQRCAALSAAYELTPRESEIVELLAHGRNTPYIEQELVLAKSTVKTHIKHIYKKCGVSSRQELLSLLSNPADNR